LVWVWNELLIALVFLRNDNTRTLNAGLAELLGRYSTNHLLVLAGRSSRSRPWCWCTSPVSASSCGD
jgi:ABC-type glycerol-3-phosphate transport system permease component